MIDVVQDCNTRPVVRILGTHGVPGNYGGFETAAEHIAKYLVRQNWRVIVYCQTGPNGTVYYDTWEGIERVNIGVEDKGWLGTAKFDWISIVHASRHRDVCLTFGYNTGVFNFLQRLKGIPNVINMDGIEWSRKRWGFLRQAILYVNERFAAAFGNHLIADHPVIHEYLLTRASARKITTATYGAEPILSPLSTDPVTALGLQPGTYFTLIARPIPENSIIEIVQAFSSKPRGRQLVILGHYDGAADAYHAAILAAASEEVRFVGPIYGDRVAVLRYHALGYFHGHTVGGTNPSLVEALAAGNPVFAHDNPYNRWVAQDAAVYFADQSELSRSIEEVLASPDRLEAMSAAARRRFAEEFTWDHVAQIYETILRRFVPRNPKQDNGEI
ncbi:DUF1972 domain-containing protein [Brevundimonas sp. TWP2-3-2]|uniref:DUF1972 domain-containing protein n=1 Tax=unclassified Brevundimonas TaxID=2622653 RepID=UPI003CF30D95